MGSNLFGWAIGECPFSPPLASFVLPNVQYLPVCWLRLLLAGKQRALVLSECAFGWFKGQPTGTCQILGSLFWWLDWDVH